MMVPINWTCHQYQQAPYGYARTYFSIIHRRHFMCFKSWINHIIYTDDHLRDGGQVRSRASRRRPNYKLNKHDA
jgi:hypothetical protein